MVAGTAAFLLPDRFTPAAFATLLLVAGLFIGCNYGWGLWLARRLGLAWEARQRVRESVERVGTQCGLQPRGVYEMAWAKHNAAALPFPQALVFTQPAVDVLTDPELDSLCAHEIAHLAEAGPVRWARVAGSFVFFPLAATRPLIGTFGWVGLLLAFAGAYLLAHAALALSRRMEERADRLATECEADPGIYARMLEKLHEASLIPAVLFGRRGTHPDLYDRLLAAVWSRLTRVPSRPPSGRNSLRSCRRRCSRPFW